MAGAAPPSTDEIRTAEVIAALSLATDLALGVELEHGLRSTLVAMRLCERLGVDRDTASDTYYACLVVYIGCTADAEVAAEIFPDDDGLLTHFMPVMHGSRPAMVTGIARALASAQSPPLVRAAQIARGLPRAARGQRRHLVAMCEVAQMLSERLGLPASVGPLFATLTERWDGKGPLGRARGDEIPLAVRIAQVARDADVQRTLGGERFAARVVGERAGAAFDPDVAGLLAREAGELLAVDPGASAWAETLEREPAPHLTLAGAQVDRALAAIGDFADLASPYLAGHSAGVAELAAVAAQRCRLAAGDVAAVRRAALVHDVGRLAVPVRIWQKPAPLTPDDWERVRLHAYQTERVLAHSAVLAALAPIATRHHERLDGSGYHRGVAASALSLPARLLGAADAYHAMTEPRPHRDALGAEQAGAALAREAKAGRLDPDAVAAVLEACGQPRPRVERPAGLTEREAEVVALLARGLQTKQIGRALGISAKTADRHVQNAYAKIGVSTRAAATLFAMEHGLTAWGELPMARAARRP